jgi:hypothetical protein
LLEGAIGLRSFGKVVLLLNVFVRTQNTRANLSSERNDQQLPEMVIGGTFHAPAAQLKAALPKMGMS